MDRSAYLHLLNRWKWMLLLAAWVAGMVGLLAASQIPPSYEAQTRLLVGPVNTDINTFRGAEVLTPTYGELVTAEPSLRAVIEQLNLDVEPVDLATEITVDANATTRILTIRMTDTDPATTAAVTNALASELVALASNSVLSIPEGRLTVIDVAVAPVEPVGPSMMVIVALSAGAGLLLAALLAMAIEYFSNTVRTSDDLAELTGSSVLGEVNVNHGYRGTPVQPLVVEAKPESKTALAYRLLASRMPLGDTGAGRVRSILVVGSQAGEQVGELSANLAAVLARTGRTVSLVDADDVDSTVSEMFVPDRHGGVSELLALAPEVMGSSEAIDAIRVKRVPNIEVILGGGRESRSVREDTLAALLEMLMARSDLVVVSGAPFHRSAQSLLWARHTDAVIFVARADSTRIENVRYAVESLRLIGARVLGSVLLVRTQAGTDRWRHRVAAPEVQAPAAATASDRNATASATGPSPLRGASSTGGQVAIATERPAVGDEGAGWH